MGRRKRRSGEGMGGGGESRRREKKNRSLQHFTEASAGCLNINLKASINNGVRHAANWGSSEPTLVSGPSLASPRSIPDWSLDRLGRHLTGVYWLVLDTVRSFFPLEKILIHSEFLFTIRIYFYIVIYLGLPLNYAFFSLSVCVFV